MRVGILGSPRPAPSSRLLPLAAGALVVALALPVFLLGGWSLKGWGVAAVLWVATQAFGLLLTRVQPSADNLARSGVLAFGMMIRLLAVLAVLLAVVSNDAHAGLAATVVYGLAYTAELGFSLLGYYGQEPTA
jgi:hypothetical protein